MNPIAGAGGEREDGFTLIEVLVAFAIGSLAMITAFQIFADSALSLSRSVRERRQTEEAVALIGALAAEPLAPGSRTGRFTDETPYEIIVTDAATALDSHANGTSLRLVTLRVGPSPSRVLLRTVLPGANGG